MPIDSKLKNVPAYVTRDQSEIRELIHPSIHGNQAQSLAEAVVKRGQTTRLHRHQQTEEIYHITCGQGQMTLADKIFDVNTGDSICIPPGSLHCIKNTGSKDLHLLCMCSPAYSHEDTELLGRE
ncbi:Mannose-6-phosphate isomerase [hydrothermal vent metagenome]|uniref:Mannose-6-phosphate isomerase n=1 Tax=hydrothermal vent metagenome TaxID=652676 RepID=A0A3B1BG34_9ZZZZ